MTFSRSSFLVAVGLWSASGFIFPQTHFGRPNVRLYAIEDLEAKLLGTPEPAPVPSKDVKPKPVPEKPKREPKPVAEKPKREPKPVPEKPKRVPEKPKVVSEKPKSEPKPAPKPVRVLKSPPAVVLTKPPPPPPSMPKVTLPKVPDTGTIGTGIALGAAPLLLAPLVALGAGRSFLANTAARREQIQQEMAAREAALKKQQRAAEVDAGGLATAVVSIHCGCVVFVPFLGAFY